MPRFLSTGARALVVGLALAVGACASPNPNFFTLVAVPGAAAAPAAKTVELRRIGLAGYLDRSEIVRATTPYRLRLSDTERWGEPLGQMVTRVLTEDLVERLPGASVFSDSGAISTQPDETVEIDVQRFDANAAGEVVLLAQVAVRHDGSGAPSVARTIRIVNSPASPSTTDLVAALSKTLGEFADDVVQML